MVLSWLGAAAPRVLRDRGLAGSPRPWEPLQNRHSITGPGLTAGSPGPRHLLEAPGRERAAETAGGRLRGSASSEHPPAPSILRPRASPGPEHPPASGPGAAARQQKRLSWARPSPSPSSPRPAPSPSPSPAHLGAAAANAAAGGREEPWPRHRPPGTARSRPACGGGAPGIPPPRKAREYRHPLPCHPALSPDNTRQRRTYNNLCLLTHGRGGELNPPAIPSHLLQPSPGPSQGREQLQPPARLLHHFCRL